jgi:hypothetical protein
MTIYKNISLDNIREKKRIKKKEKRIKNISTAIDYAMLVVRIDWLVFNSNVFSSIAAI